MKDYKKYSVSEIVDLYEKDNYCEIFGKIYDLEFKTLSSGRISASFDIVDSTGAISCMMFLEKKDLDQFKEDFDEYSIRRGVFVKVFGKINTDFSAKIIVESICIEKNFKRYLDTASKKRVELHLGSNYSNNFDSVLDLRKLRFALEAMEHEAVGITDYGSIQCYPEAYYIFSELSGRDFLLKDIYKCIRVLYGVELDLSAKNFTEKFNSIIYVKSQYELKKFYKFMSEYLTEYAPKNLSYPKSKLNEIRDAILIGSGNGNGELYSALIDEKNDEEIKEIATFYDFLEIQPISNIIQQHYGKYVLDVEFIKEINKKIVSIGEELGKPVVATGSVKYIDKMDYFSRNVVLFNNGADKLEKDGTFYFRTTNEMLEEFLYLGYENAYRVVVENTNNITSMIDSIEPIPRGSHYPSIDGADEILKNTCYNKAKEIYGEKLSDVVKKRLELEIEPTIDNEFSSIYCIAQKVTDYMRNENKLFFSRGTLGSSFIAFLMGITEINPLPAHYCCSKCKHIEFFNTSNGMSGFDLPDKKCPKCETFMKKDGQDIPFETLGAFEGDAEPLISLNCIGISEVLDKIFDTKDVCFLGKIETLFGDTVSNYLENYIDEKNIFVNSASFRNYERNISGIKEKTECNDNELIFLPNDKEIYDFTPLQYNESERYRNEKMTHFDYRTLCGPLLFMGFVHNKYDNYGLIDTLETLHKITGIDPMSVPMDDKETLNIFTSTESLNFIKDNKNIETGVLNIPEFESDYNLDILYNTKPKTFTELVKFLGLLHGTNVWENNAEELIKNKGLSINDIICNRDDIMNYLVYKGLDREKAFRIMAKVRKGMELDEETEQYMIESGISNWYIESCNKIGYLFPKAHSVSYMLMIYRIAYFKVHYPEAFYAVHYDFYNTIDDETLGFIDSGLEVVEMKIEELKKLGLEDCNNIELYEKLEIIEEMLLRKVDFNKVKELMKDI